MPKDYQLQVRVERDLWTRFCQVAKANNEIPSELIREFMQEYVRKYNPPNGQLELTKFSKKREPGSLRELCEWCDKPAEYVFDAIDEDGTRVHTRVCRFHLESFKVARWETFGYESLTI